MLRSHDEAKRSKKLDDAKMVYQLEGRPRLRTALPLGLQHEMCIRDRYSSIFIGDFYEKTTIEVRIFLRRRSSMVVFQFRNQAESPSTARSRPFR